MAPGIVGFVALPLLTHLFPPRDYGDYTLVKSTVRILALLLGWTSLSVVRFFPVYEKENKGSEFYGVVLLLWSVSLGVLIVLFSGGLLLLKPAMSSTLYVLMWFGIPIFALRAGSLLLCQFLRARRQLGLYSGFHVWESAATVGLGIGIVVAFDTGVAGLLVGWILSLSLALPFLWYVSLGSAAFTIKNAPLSMTKEIAKYGVPLMVGNLTAWILSLSDRYIIEFCRSSEEVGVYSAGYGIAEHTMIILTYIFSLTTGSLLYGVHEKQGEQASRRYMSELTRLYLLLAVPGMVGLSMVAQPLMAILTDPQYQAAHRIMPLIAVGIFLLGLQQRFATGLHLERKMHLFMFAVLGAGACNVGLNLIFIPAHGYVAAAWTTLAAYVVLLCLTVTFSRGCLSWAFPWGTLIRSAGAAAVMGALVYFVALPFSANAWLTIAVAVPAGALTYGAVLLVLGEIRGEERRKAWRATRGILLRRRQKSKT